MRKKKTFEYTSYFAAEFNGFLQYRISGGSNGLEERRVLKSLDDYLIQSGMVKKKLDGIIVDAWINSLNVGGNTKAHYVSVYRQFAHYLTGLGYKAYIPPPLQIKRNYTPYVFTSEEMKRLFEACDNIPARRSFYSVPILSTYMGHTDIYGTELYLRLTPECYEHIVDCAEKDTGDIFPEVLP